MQINHIGIILRPNTPLLSEVYKIFLSQAKKYNIKVSLETSSADMIDECGIDFDTLCKESDILVSIGGDGTLISLIRRSISYDKPIFGINMGRLGFLTSININELDDFLARLQSGDYAIYSHMLLEGKLFKGGLLEGSLANDREQSRTLFCVNEFLISKSDIAGMININAKINGKYFNTYRSDGLIIGTPTGSSAYNISAGGSIVYPYNRNILLTPICAHSLTQKPLILNDMFDLEFSLQGGSGKVLIDGQDMFSFSKDDVLKVRASNKSARLIYNSTRDYFEVLREKFNWGL